MLRLAKRGFVLCIGWIAMPRARFATTYTHVRTIDPLGQSLEFEQCALDVLGGDPRELAVG